MEFIETGLPPDQKIYSAFMAYARRMKDSAPEYQRQQYGLRVAQLLNEVAGHDKDLVILPLLIEQPEGAWGVLEKRFGKNVALLKKEALLQADTQFAHIGQASDRTKIFFMASDIVNMDSFISDTLGKKKDGTVFIPDISAYQRLSKIVSGKTSCPALEDRLKEKVEELDIAKKELMLELGIPENNIRMPGNHATYPPFHTLGLDSTRGILAAYDIVTKDPRTVPENVFAAIEVAQLINAETTGNTTAIAAALIDLSIPSRTAADLDIWMERIGVDAAALLELKSLHVVETLLKPDYILDAPVEFRQMAMAFAAINLTLAKASVVDAVDRAKLDKDVPLHSLEQELLHIQDFVESVRRVVLPVAGQTGLPRLDNMVRHEIGEITKMVDNNLPEKPAAPKLLQYKPKPPGLG